MAWLFILIAGLEEVVSVVAMKYVDGIKNKKPIAVMIIGFLPILSESLPQIGETKALIAKVIA